MSIENSPVLLVHGGKIPLSDTYAEAVASSLSVLHNSFDLQQKEWREVGNVDRGTYHPLLAMQPQLLILYADGWNLKLPDFPKRVQEIRTFTPSRGYPSYLRNVPIVVWHESDWDPACRDLGPTAVIKAKTRPEQIIKVITALGVTTVNTHSALVVD